jgi:hypothetical protein
MHASNGNPTDQEDFQNRMRLQPGLVTDVLAPAEIEFRKVGSKYTTKYAEEKKREKFISVPIL